MVHLVKENLDSHGQLFIDSEALALGRRRVLTPILLLCRNLQNNLNRKSSVRMLRIFALFLVNLLYFSSLTILTWRQPKKAQFAAWLIISRKVRTTSITFSNE